MTAQIKSPQPEYGIKSPLPRYDVKKTPIGLVIKFVTIKNVHDISVRPATKHKISSGNIGKIIIIKKLNFALLKNLTHFFSDSLPTIKTTSFLPKVWPSKKATALPKSIPARLKSAPWRGPNTTAPAIVNIVEGIGMNVTCKNWSKKKTNLPQKPVFWIKFLSFSTEFKSSQSPVKYKIKKSPTQKTIVRHKTKSILKIFPFFVMKKY